MSFTDLSTVNAVLNLISFILLTSGYIQIKRKNRLSHMRIMIAALVTSGLFLVSYLIYHAQVGSVPYPHHDWTRFLYFIILIPHILLAALMVPFILLAVRYALREEFEKHKKLMRWVWPVWVFVSISGVVVYLMLYRL
jgi:putative membrane protein